MNIFAGWLGEDESERIMRTLCDACESAAAIVFCAADEAALCRACDEKVGSFFLSFILLTFFLQLILVFLHVTRHFGCVFELLTGPHVRFCGLLFLFVGGRIFL